MGVCVSTYRVLRISECQGLQIQVWKFADNGLCGGTLIVRGGSEVNIMGITDNKAMRIWQWAVPPPAV